MFGENTDVINFIGAITSGFSTALIANCKSSCFSRRRKRKKSLLAQGGALMADLLDTQLEETESETHVELNFAVLKLKHIRKRKK